jgi:hypothetical protein
MSDEKLIKDLEFDARDHDRAAERLEADARNRRLMAERARKGIEYVRKRTAIEQTAGGEYEKR